MKQTSTLQNIIFLWKYLGKRRRMQFGFLFLLMILSVVADIVSIGSIVPFLSALTNPEMLMKLSWFHPIIVFLHIQSSDELLLPLTIGFVLAAILASGLRILLLWVNTRLSASMGIDLRNDVYARTLYQPYEFHMAHNSSELISMATEKVSMSIHTGIMHVLMLVSATITSFAIILTLLLINAAVAILAFVLLGGGYILIGYLTRRYIRHNGQIIAQNQPVAIKCMQEGLGGIRDIIMDNSQDIFTKLYRGVATNIQMAGMRNSFLSNLPKSLLEMLSITLIAILAYYLETQGDTKQVALPILGALALGAQRLLPALQQIYFSWSLINGNQAILSDVVELLQKPLPVAKKSDNNSIKNLPLKDKISLVDVSFRYKGTTEDVLKNININIKKGTKVGFIGTTGSGKSTLLDIIMGLLVPSSGTLLIDDVPVDKSNIRNWQGNIAHVPQSIFLSDASMAENIAFGIPREQIDMSQVKQAAKQAQIDTFIETLPQQYETIVGERGVRLSGGQRQRIGIARALYKKANVIVFDEATSALDNETEKSVMNAINSLGKDLTVLIIAHRLSTLQDCDLIYKLENGKTIKAGTYEEMVDE